MTWVLAPVPAGGTAGTHGLCCIDPVRGGGGMERNRHGIRDQTGFGGCGTLFIFFWPPCFQFKYNDITDIAKKNIFWHNERIAIWIQWSMVPGDDDEWWSSFLDSTHFWRPIRVNPSFFALLLYTIFEASPPEALFVSRKSGESNHPCLGSDGQNVGFSWTRGNQGYSYSGYPIQTDPRTSVTSIFYHFQPPLLWCLYFWALAAPRSERPGAEPLEPSSPFPVGKVCT